MSAFDRIVIEDVAPLVDGGRHPAKTVVGEHLPVHAVVWRDGHRPVTVVVRWTGPDGEGSLVPMTLVDDDADRWSATVVATVPGLWSFRVEAWTDAWQAWREGITAKIEAGHPAEQLANDLETGARLLERAGASAADLRDDALAPAVRVARAETVENLREHPASSAAHAVYADRPEAAFGAWYELFPRSTGGWDEKGRPVHGTLRTAAADLPRIAAMGFDVVHLTPIHPIGHRLRKGRDNSPAAEPGDPGCPWAIGSAEGGHDVIDPALGDIADFKDYVAAARELGLEVAMELALQCSPDHPWLHTHPEWFDVRPDGTIACAENPPRVWSDIHPLNFDLDPEGLYAEIRRIVTQWIDLGVSAFRVDNPHTKPAGLWQRLIWDVKRDHPHVLFLAEAFTRPAVQKGLSKLGFTQTYTYFMWRDTKQELIDFGEQLVRDADFLRPNLFPSNHDVHPPVLHRPEPAAFAIRAALAATLSPAWGIYSGYEICENEPATPGGYAPANAEKFELRPRDFTAGPSIGPWITQLNLVRRRRPALRRLRTLRFHAVDDEALLAYSKTDASTGDTVLCVVTLDPRTPRHGVLALSPRDLGIHAGRVRLEDEINGLSRPWDGPLQVGLDPSRAVAAIYRVFEEHP
ncbi:maltotransferase domain-containing protein [Nonomuraea sp. NPDC050153]|uniref:maltotransferase domain-containing protein n=1 Tax=Nonomuraea sp. NPDC050153 TaxID=3364359 RepID=UPI0037900FBC